jgi:hypothetical protein
MNTKVNHLFKLSLSISVSLILILNSFYSSTVESSNLYNNKNIFYETSSHIRIITKNPHELELELLSNGFDILANTITPNSLELIVTPYELRKLEEKNYEITILENGRPFIDIQKERQKEMTFIPPGYPDLNEIYGEMNSTEDSYPSICKMVDLTEKYNVSPTYEGRHLYALKISDNVSEDEDEPTFLMVSCHHCREIVTPVLALYAIDELTSNYDSDPDIKDLVDEYEIWISPVWNPDGYEYVFNVDNMWRKNRRYFSEFGTYGVDLNRNYPFGWYSQCSGSNDPSSITYKGPSPASEAETQTMMAFSDDQHFTKVLDYHSYGREVLWGYSCHNHPFDSFLQSEAQSLSTASGYYGSIRSPSAEGENYEWQLAMNGSYAYLMETHTSFQPSYSSALDEAALVWQGTIWMLQRPISLSGHVKNSVTDQPIEAEINIKDIDFPNDEEFFSEPSAGRYHLFLPAGTYTIEFSAEKYITASHEVTITQNSAEIFDVALERITEPPEIPEISGPTTGFIGEDLEYSIITTDPDGDDIYYLIDWGDGTTTDWLGPFESGISANIIHQWNNAGNFEIKAKARDIYFAESDLSEPYQIYISGPIIEIGPILGGLFTVRSKLSNIGDTDATNLDWSIKLEGGAFIGKETTDSIAKIEAGDKTTIKSNVIIGGGPTLITIDVVMAEGSFTKERKAQIFLFIIL